MICLHSASWSRGNEPRSGGLGLMLMARPPGEPKPDIVRRDAPGFWLRRRCRLLTMNDTAQSYRFEKGEACKGWMRRKIRILG
jgi:hypothetical protein